MPDVYTYDLQTNIGKVRLLLNDVAEPWTFNDDEIEMFLELEGNVIKLAAAQAIETNADNELLASKVLRDKEITTDGAKLADAMRKRASALRDQVTLDTSTDDEGYFVVVSPQHPRGPELTQRRRYY